MLVDRLAVLLFERSQQTVKTMETVQGLLSSGALEQDHEGYALPEPTAAELRARSVKITAILATLDLAQPSAALEAQLEARVADSRRQRRAPCRNVLRVMMSAPMTSIVARCAYASCRTTERTDTR